MLASSSVCSPATAAICKALSAQQHLGCPSPRRTASQPRRVRAGPSSRVVPQAATDMASQQQQQSTVAAAIGWTGVHHVGFICQDLQKSREFYEDVLGLTINPERPDDRLDYEGMWFWLGPEMIHLMVLPNPDPLDGRPQHGGRDRHVAVGVQSMDALQARLEQAGVPYTRSKSGRQAIFFRDPDANTLECVELPAWR